MLKCPRCGCNLLRDYENWYCLMCGTLSDGTGIPSDVLEQRYLVEHEIRDVLLNKRIKPFRFTFKPVYPRTLNKDWM